MCQINQEFQRFAIPQCWWQRSYTISTCHLTCTSSLKPDSWSIRCTGSIFVKFKHENRSSWPVQWGAFQHSVNRPSRNLRKTGGSYRYCKPSAADAIDTNHDVLILLQLLYLNGSVALAIRMNELNNAMTSSMVDDIFYIFQNCSGRAAACGAHWTRILQENAFLIDFIHRKFFSGSLESFCVVLGRITTCLKNEVRSAHRIRQITIHSLRSLTFIYFSGAARRPWCKLVRAAERFKPCATVSWFSSWFVYDMFPHSLAAFSNYQERWTPVNDAFVVSQNTFLLINAIQVKAVVFIRFFMTFQS